ncbi:SHOCT domain-containing protein [Terrisporobacter glycolicus]|nr:SHOCT domain-containing protein [Terrisporobacter glycolicus]
MDYKKNVIKTISYLWIIVGFVFCAINHLFEFRIMNEFIINAYMLKILIVMIIIPIIILLKTTIKEELEKREKEKDFKVKIGVVITIISLISFIFISTSYYEWSHGGSGISNYGMNFMAILCVTVFTIGIILIKSPIKKLNSKLKTIILKEEEQAKFEENQTSWYGVEKLKNCCQMEIDRIAKTRSLSSDIEYNQKEYMKQEDERQSLNKDKTNLSWDLIENEKRFEKLQSELSKAVISNVISKEEIFSGIEITQTKLEISETGAIEITVKVKNNTTYHIDGSIRAIFYDENNKKIGIANLVFPYLGIVDEGYVKGICIDTEENQKYSVKYEVNNLWVIQSLPNVDDENLMEVLRKLKTKKIDLSWAKIKDTKNLKKIIDEDTNIYYDNIVDLGNVEYSNDLIKIFKNIELVDLDSNYDMRRELANILEISDINFSTAYNQLKKSSAIKIEDGFINVVKWDIEMTEEDFYNLKSKIKSMNYEKLAKLNNKMRKMRDRTGSKYKSGRRKYDLVRFNYIGKKIQLSDKYGVPNKNGVYEINQKSSLINYLNKEVTDCDSLYFFLERIKSNGIGVRLAPEVVKLRKQIIEGSMTSQEEQIKIDEIMMKFNFKQIPKVNENNNYEKAIQQQLRNLKLLLYEGIITQEEFNNKKKELL